MKSANIISKKFYFDWQQWEVWNDLATMAGIDLHRLLSVIMTQGMNQFGQQISETLDENIKNNSEVPDGGGSTGSDQAD